MGKTQKQDTSRDNTVHNFMDNGQMCSVLQDLGITEHPLPPPPPKKTIPTTNTSPSHTHRTLNRDFSLKDNKQHARSDLIEFV